MREGISGRDIAIAAGGVAVGITGSRLLAPLVAMGTGALKSRVTGDPFLQLEEDHRLILDTLRSMEQVNETGMGKRSMQFLTLKRKLAKHALAEEDVVYPLLNDEAERQEAVKHLYEKHADMKIMLFEIETALMKRRAVDQVCAPPSHSDRTARAGGGAGAIPEVTASAQ